MAGAVRKSGGKAKSKAAKSAKPAAKAAHKGKLSGGRKIATTRKVAPKHTTKAKAPASRGGDDNYMKFSGKFTVRLPKSLHQALVDRAEKEGVSLNLFVTNALSRTVALPGKKR
ncbi:MAG: toxin-antitoxin system HicB family antitoxin [Cyanobacteria bacterium SZAS LIN-2]|nr:toxin-antitoxin system HicB family antitoxin [Cyanobacteria bacterium SZAS LIN-3]MBS1996890.1 toxin-antitoxin system HicB family antitoxin [Cyanobacteria bacterium SZAS LIN-2]MBS2008919.1 toxin-antitoxin system HicB family antitoxin [Cyanobacteria bacterium SZAS TMP-1]